MESIIDFDKGNFDANINFIEEGLSDVYSQLISGSKNYDIDIRKKVEKLLNEKAIISLFMQDSKKVGFCIYNEKEHPILNIKYPFILAYWIHPNFRKTNNLNYNDSLAANFFEKLLDNFKLNCFGTLAFQVNTTNQILIRFLQNKGFNSNSLILAKTLNDKTNNLNDKT